MNLINKIMIKSDIVKECYHKNLYMFKYNCIKILIDITYDDILKYTIVKLLNILNNPILRTVVEYEVVYNYKMLIYYKINRHLEYLFRIIPKNSVQFYLLLTIIRIHVIIFNTSYLTVRNY